MRYFLLFRLLAKLLMQETTQRITALERDLFCVASTGAFIHTFPVVSPGAFMIYFTRLTVYDGKACRKALVLAKQKGSRSKAAMC